MKLQPREKKATIAGIKASDFACYRQFLVEYIASSKLSYRSFARQYQDYVSFPFLSKLLRRTSAGAFVCEVNLRPEKLAALFRAMGLTAADIRHLVICRLKNDHTQGRYKYSSTFSTILQSLQNGSGEGAKDSVEITILSCLKALQNQRRLRVIEELRHQLEIEIARSASPLKAQSLNLLLGELST